MPAQGEFGSDIPAGDVKLANLFLRCRHQMPYLVWHGVETEGLKEFISFLEHLSWGPQLPALIFSIVKETRFLGVVRRTFLIVTQQTAKLHKKHFFKKLHILS
jgi:hypothetical protein